MHANPVLIVGLIAIAIVILMKIRTVPSRTVTATQLPSVVAALTSSGNAKAFAVFMFSPPGVSAGGVVNLQYSIESGRTGLDWVMKAPRNITDVDRVATFMRSHGFLPDVRMQHHVQYLRVEQVGIEQLGIRIITELYGISADAPLEVIADGFPWTG